MASAADQRPLLRKDAERNRVRVLAAARDTFAEQGIEAPLEEIARRATVGIGTLYRRFPTRTALIAALFEDRAREYAQASEAALAAKDAWDGLAGLIEHICELQAEDRGFADVLTASFPSAPRLQAYMSAARRNGEKLVARARREGGVRPDFAPADLFWITVVNCAYLDATRDIAPNGWRRYLALILDAIHTPGDTRLPPPPTNKELDHAVRAIGRRCTGA